MTSMFKDWWNRLTPPAGAKDPDETRHLFAQALDDARARETSFRPLFEQLAYALRTAESTVPIDRATVPLDLTMGPAKIKELAAQIKLSPYLKNNITALVHHFRENQRDLKNAERAGAMLMERPELLVRGEAIQLVQSLFLFLPASREKFRDYPLFYQLFAGGVDEAPDGDDAIPEDLAFFLTDGEPGVGGGEFDAGDVNESLRSPETVMSMIAVPPLTLEVGIDVVPLIDRLLGGDLMDRIIPVRVDIAEDLGFIMPGVQFKDNLDLRADCYVIKVRGNVVAEGELMIGYHLAIETPASDAAAGTPLVGFPTTDPAFGRPAMWVTRAEGARAAKLGFEVVDATQVLVMHLDEVVRSHAHEILQLEELSLMLDKLREKSPQTIEAVIPDKLELADYHLILKNLLRERVSIRDQVTILERLAHAAKPVHPFYLQDRFGENRASIESIMLMEISAQIRPLNDPSILTEMVRVALSRQICASLASADQTLDVVLLDASVEQVIMDGIQTSTTGQTLVLPPARRELLVNRLAAECGRLDRAIVLCDPRIRPFVKQLMMRALPRLAVLSHAEVHPQYRVQSVATVSLVES
jgi:hypothetical protein